MKMIGMERKLQKLLLAPYEMHFAANCTSAFWERGGRRGFPALQHDECILSTALRRQLSFFCIALHCIALLCFAFAAFIVLHPESFLRILSSLGT